MWCLSRYRDGEAADEASARHSQAATSAWGALGTRRDGDRGRPPAGSAALEGGAIDTVPGALVGAGTRLTADAGTRAGSGGRSRGRSRSRRRRGSCRGNLRGLQGGRDSRGAGRGRDEDTTRLR